MASAFQNTGYADIDRLLDADDIAHQPLRPGVLYGPLDISIRESRQRLERWGYDLTTPIGAAEPVTARAKAA